MRKKTFSIRYTAGQPAQRIFSPEYHFPFIHKLPEGALLPKYQTLKVLVWNIFKQQRAEWQSVITGFGKDSHLVMLQEAQTTPELVTFATCHFIGVDQVPALSLPQHPSGVMTLAKSIPIFCCPLREREPLLRLAKSALITVYPMPNGKMLMAVNMHAINFSLGIDVYRKQLETVGEHMQHHRGPILMGGDFNAWSQPRSQALYHFAQQHHLKEVHFDHDFRRTAFGRPLDFIFYRGLSVKQAVVLKTEASDHNPLLAEFSFT